MKIRYHFKTVDGEAYSTIDVRPGEENAKSFEAAENIGYSAATAKLVGMERIIAQ